MKNNQNGFLNMIISLVVFVFFITLVYVCLDILELIEVPPDKSIPKIVENYIVDKTSDLPENYIQGKIGETVDGITSKDKKIITIQATEDETSKHTNIVSPVVEDYSSSSTTKPVTPANKNLDVSVVTSFKYYEQLDEYGQILYKGLEDNIENLKSGTYTIDYGDVFNDLLHEEGGDQKLNNSFQLAINALNFDYTELFFLDISKMYLLTTITTKWIVGTTYTVAIGPNNNESYLNSSFADENAVNDALAVFRGKKQALESSLRGSMENQIRTVHDYLIENVEYDRSISQSNIYNAYGAMVNGTAVCEGYARAFKSVMDDLNVACLIACGTGLNSEGKIESHAWNYVRVDNQWYAVDVTWDDPIITGYGYVDQGVFSRYYLKGSEAFFKNHKEDGNIVGNAGFSYPTLSTTDYNN